MISHLSGQVSSADIMITLIQHLTDVINTMQLSAESRCNHDVST